MGDGKRGQNNEGIVAREARTRIIISGVILAIFWGALIADYWPDLLSGAMRIFNTMRTVGATEEQSQFFEVRNNSNASVSQVRGVLKKLDSEYGTIIRYTKTDPPNRPKILFVNGRGWTIMDGAELVINYDNGVMDTNLAPLFLVLMSENIQFTPAQGLVAQGGHALQVVEASGLGDSLLRQPLDNWVALLRQENAYVPL